MEITNEEITKYALELGFGDIQFANTDELINNTAISPGTILSNATCLIVLFAEYLPAQPAPKGSIAVSAYYIASNFAYHTSQKLVEYLTDQGANAVHTVNLDAKQAALKTGGFIGDNGFYHHPRFGSYVCIQTVLTDALPPPVRTPNEQRTECLHCGACMRACPSKAVGNVLNCLREHINSLMPSSLRGDVYQLFGCEKCQSACPLNKQKQSEPHTYRIADLLEGKHTAELKTLAGANLVRPGRLLSQAVLYAANTNQYHLSKHIETLAQTANEPVRSHAVWAYNKLTERQSNDHS